VLDLLIGMLLVRVENEGDQARLRTLRDLDAAALRLRDACRVLLDGRYPDLELREAMLVAAGGEEQLELAVTRVTDLTRPPEDHYYQDLLSRYNQMRQFLPTLLRTVPFQGTAAGRQVLDALAFLRQLEGQRKPDLSDAPRGVITAAWRSLALDADNRIDRHGYTFCVLERLRDGLRRHEAQRRIALAQAWGGGEVATADGLRFVVPVRTLNAAPNPKCFGRGHGATFFNFANDQFAGQGGVVVPGTPKDAPYLLAGLLEQWSGALPSRSSPTAARTPTRSSVRSGCSGFRFNPRLADVGDARLWRLDRAANYGPLTGLARNRIDRELITRNWDDLLRLAGSLKLGTVGAVELLHSLQGGRSSTLGPRLDRARPRPEDPALAFILRRRGSASAHRPATDAPRGPPQGGADRFPRPQRRAPPTLP
jgi:hypothetical protein